MCIRDSKEIVPLLLQVPERQTFQTLLFSKIVPNCKKLGLLDAADGWLRQKFTELGVIAFEAVSYTHLDVYKRQPSWSSADIAEAVDEVGGDMNAFTTKEYTAFYIRLLSEDCLLYTSGRSTPRRRRSVTGLRSTPRTGLPSSRRSSSISREISTVSRLGSHSSTASATTSASPEPTS